MAEVHVPTVIGMHGYARSGKDTVAQFLAPFGYQRLAFADRLRECMYALDPIVGADSRGRPWRLQEIVDEVGWDEAKGVTLGKVDGPEIRRLLQVFGTEVGRELLSDTIWVDVVLKQIEEGLKDNPSARFVITDVRFPNEEMGLRTGLGFLAPRDIELWKVTRPGVNPVNSHVSDAGLADSLFDAVLSNHGTLDDLDAVVRAVLLG
jgi:hypothetical protein